MLYKIVQAQLSQNNVPKPKMQEWHFILVCFHKAPWGNSTLHIYAIFLCQVSVSSMTLAYAELV